MRILQAKANRILQEPLLLKQVRAEVVMAVVSVGIEKNQVKRKAKEQRLNRIFDSIIQDLAGKEKMKSGVHTGIKSAA